MLTRKHFKRAAEKLAAAEITVAERARLAKLLAELFAEDNERFNRKLFFRAVEPIRAPDTMYDPATVF